jgi:hypothetical protein
VVAVSPLYFTEVFAAAFGFSHGFEGVRGER